MLRVAPRPGLWASKDEVLHSIGRASVCTLNALTAALHDGSADLNYGRKGHIKGSVNVPYPDLLQADGCLRPASELRSAFEAVGAMRAERVICYCGGGIAATLDALALQLAGQTRVAVYDASLQEWVADAALPMETGA